MAYSFPFLSGEFIWKHPSSQSVSVLKNKKGTCLSLSINSACYQAAHPCSYDYRIIEIVFLF
jgi:hypothetical protein